MFFFSAGGLPFHTLLSARAVPQAFGVPSRRCVLLFCLPWSGTVLLPLQTARVISLPFNLAQSLYSHRSGCFSRALLSQRNIRAFRSKTQPPVSPVSNTDGARPTSPFHGGVFVTVRRSPPKTGLWHGFYQRPHGHAQVFCINSGATTFPDPRDAFFFAFAPGHFFSPDHTEKLSSFPSPEKRRWANSSLFTP